MVITFIVIYLVEGKRTEENVDFLRKTIKKREKIQNP